MIDFNYFIMVVNIHADIYVAVASVQLYLILLWLSGINVHAVAIYTFLYDYIKVQPNQI